MYELEYGESFDILVKNLSNHIVVHYEIMRLVMLRKI